MHAEAEPVGHVPAGADAGIPAVAAVAAPAFQAKLLADPVVVAGVVVRGAEVPAAQADVPGRGDVRAGVGAELPATQRVGVLALVDVVVAERVLDHQVAEVGVTAFHADGPRRGHLPAVAANQAVAGLAALAAFEEVEVAGPETVGGAAVGAADVAGDEPVAIAALQVGPVAVATGGLGDRGGRERESRERGGNQEKPVHGGAPLLLFSGPRH